MPRMFPKKEFFFIRHGQTDQNVSGIYTEEDIPINATGRKQAEEVESIISLLPVQSVCHSPLLRAKQTKELITPRLSIPHIELLNLGECNIEIWDAMTVHGEKVHKAHVPSVQNFMQNVANGLQEALSHPGPVLIVAHGGVHWAICHHINVSPPWEIDNCIPVHFTPNEKGEWTAKKLKSHTLV